MRLSKFFSYIKINLKFLLSFIIFYPLLSIAQIEDVQSLPIDDKNGSLLVYIDYSESDDTERYLRSEIPFATYVRDPRLAQIHVLIVDQKTGSGGRRFNISFIGKEDFKDQDQTLFYISPQSDSDDQKRDGLARVVKLGLMPYISQTEMAEQIEIRYDDDKVNSVQEMIDDSWDYWIFSVDLGGGLKAEESRNAYTITSALKADRVTEMWKFENEFTYLYEEENFKDDGESLKSSLKEWRARSSLVKSLNIKWSAGFFGELYSTTFRNINLGWSLAPGIEYNIYPWPEAERRKFIFGYRVGYTYLRYYKETLFDQTYDGLLFHAFEIELDLVQPWGNAEFDFEASQYLELKDKYSLKLDIQLAFRISSGWEFVLDSEIESIHDQIYLPKGDATIDEILLKRRQLATTYDIGLTLGFRYTFGSIYNNIINRRF
jgi:hypothetical protein